MSIEFLKSGSGTAGATGTGTLNTIPKVANATGPVYADSVLSDVSGQLRYGTATTADANADVLIGLSGTGKRVAIQSKATPSTEAFSVQRSTGATVFVVGAAATAANAPNAIGDVRIGIDGAGTINTGLTLIEQTTGSSRTITFGINNSRAFLGAYGAPAFGFGDNQGATLRSDGAFGWVSNTTLTSGSADTGISRDSASGDVAIGTGAAGSTAGRLRTSGLTVKAITTAKTADYTSAATDYFIPVDINGASGNVTITLSSTNAKAGQIYVIKCTTTHATRTVILSPSSGNIDGGASVTMNPVTIKEAATVIFDGTNWFVMGVYDAAL